VVGLTNIELAAQAEPQEKITYVIVPGAYGGAWNYRVIGDLLAAEGHSVYRVQLTGLGERVHLASPDIGLETHITDVVNTLLWEDLRNVVLVGHSYGGMVITGVADRVPERIRRLVYVDAFLPNSGESLVSLAEREGMPRAWTVQDGYAVFPGSATSSSVPRNVPQPLKTFTDALHLNGNGSRLPATYILTFLRGEERDDFQPFADRAAARGWRVVRMEANHNPQRSAPNALLPILLAGP
jgi:pimeloyl-ACP methyl ester carboxylesterase